MISQEEIMNMPEKELRAKLMYFAYRYYDYTIDDTSTLKVRKVYEGEDKPKDMRRVIWQFRLVDALFLKVWQ